jgi:GDP/UDP-N,N'-diacetylbacillosamine 2-epimerase (hydrolysing)
MKKIAVLTGTRADFGILTPVMEAIDKHQDLDLSVIATGMHTIPEFGNTIEIVKGTFPNTHQVPISMNTNTARATIKGMAECTTGTNELLDTLNPDMFLFLGDRSESYAATIAPLVRGIPIAHIHGGDRTKAGLDEYFRHALTKISNLHFPATSKSAERIVRLGENPQYVFNVGSPSLDTILNKGLLPRGELYSKYGISRKKPLVLMIQHPVTSQIDASGEQIRATLQAIEEEDLEALVIYPNNDPGHESIIEEIEKRRGKSGFYIHKNLPHIDYLSAIRDSDLVIGNSSSSTIDGSAFRTPIINVGIRQEGRERGNNVLDVGYNMLEIRHAINTCLHNSDFRRQVAESQSPYGNGTAGKQIAEILAEIEITPEMMQKQITY